LAALGQRFGNHGLKDKAAYAYVTADETETEGLSQGLLAAARRKAERQGRAGWLFDLSEPCYFPLMKQAACRGLRRRMYEARQRVAFHPNDCNNEAVVRRIVALRAGLAHLLGYATYADYALEHRMAGTPARVHGFLDTLIRAALPAARRELADLEAFARREGLDGKLQAWDVSFYAEKWRKLHYNIEEEKLRRYFPLQAVRGGVFALAEKLYGLRFERVTDVPLYHPDVAVYAVFDGARFMGLLYLDFYARPSKQGGAWMTTFRGQSRPDGQQEVRPLVQLVFNFEPPRPDGDSLLTFSQLQTFLHEFGHGLHALLSDCRYGGLSGTRVPRDFVELPSQFMENWAFEKPFLDLFARHEATGKPLPAKTVERLRASRRFMGGYNAVRQLSFATLDMAWHTLAAPAEVKAVAAFERKAVAALELFPPVPETNMSVQFSHIFSGGYAAGYYGYKWAEVLDADAFGLFLENGLFDAATAARFRQAVLSQGGGRDAMEMYIAFRGREPRLDALLQREGWVDMPKPKAKPAVSAVVRALEADFAAAARANGPEKRRILQSFFKTAPGQYGAGDSFYGVTVPQTRTLAKRYAARCTDADWAAMLAHPQHEMRLCALLMLKMRMQAALKKRREADIEACYALYTAHTAGINNWDLVDLSAPDIVGAYALYKGQASILYDWARRPDLWAQRIAVVATYAFIREGQAEPTFRVVDKFMQHPHDLIHKACGWMLREVGKRVSEDSETAFLVENDRFKRMPRTMLRYAIERFPEAKRVKFLQKSASKSQNGKKS
ncbi:MAG: DNA alkylation repair protein, partial [Bacteroidales bacterium]|nr:DNA alkylation repair protein [Bacteroidales bacterium]